MPSKTNIFLFDFHSEQSNYYSYGLNPIEKKILDYNFFLM